MILDDDFERNVEAELARTAEWNRETLEAEITRLRQLLSEAEKREREARAKALEEAAAYHLAKMKLFQKTSETAIVPSTIERSKLAIVFHEASAVALRALQSEER